MSDINLPVPKNLLAFLAPNKLGQPFLPPEVPNGSDLYIQLIWGQGHEYGHVIVYQAMGRYREEIKLSTVLHGETNRDERHATITVLYYIRFMVNEDNDIEIDNIQGHGSSVRDYLRSWEGNARNQQKSRMKLIVPYMMYYLCSAAFKAGIRRVISLPAIAMDATSCGDGIKIYLEEKNTPKEERVVEFKPSSGLDEAIGYYDTMPVKLGFSKVPVGLIRGTSRISYESIEEVHQFIPSELGLESMALAILKSPKPAELTYGPSASYIFRTQKNVDSPSVDSPSVDKKITLWDEMVPDKQYFILAEKVVTWHSRYYEHLYFVVKWVLQTINHKDLADWFWSDTHIYSVVYVS